MGKEVALVIKIRYLPVNFQQKRRGKSSNHR